MPLSYLIDENLRGPLWYALRRVRLSDGSPLDMVCVGDDDAPAFSTLDPELLKSIEADGRILVSRDKRSLPAHLDDHLAAGGSCPGIFLVRDRARIPAVIEYLLLAAECSQPDEWRNRIQYIPDE